MAKKQKKKQPASKVAKVYEISGDSIKAKNKKCPKCNVFMANHKDRWTCGRCQYMEKK
ncbi:MAG: 30S ribosomal protein S27ae [Nanoarchaeota archaeon]|nr:30S ribosomal protein S27ae [Nanoarchaeota archaeon]MBU1030687.1 30S ribosomal protein S27ae [Nanoarchaeota archaeon]MBU1849346.1 30S ribosomal protein S27ae [Nanoarchaeota archaeon]